MHEVFYQIFIRGPFFLYNKSLFVRRKNKAQCAMANHVECINLGGNWVVGGLTI